VPEVRPIGGLGAIGTSISGRAARPGTPV
jgi:hypothetical protein